MDFASILGFGAIGLGFLLAWFSYRLLASGTRPERPVYIYMIFCLALVAVGAGLQYTDSRYKSSYEQRSRDYDNLKEQDEAIGKNLVSTQTALSEAQSKLSSTLATLASTQSSLDDVKNQNKRMAESMKAVIEALTPTRQPLEAVSRHVTDGGACSGGAHGEPLPHGNEDGAKISSALAGIATASRIAQQHVQ